MQKCPLCGGTVGNGVCLSCGYEIPDENTIAAFYNYDPDDYNRQEEQHSSDEIEEISAVPGAASGTGKAQGSPEWSEMDSIGIPSAESVGQALKKKPSSGNAAAANNRAAVNIAPPPPVYTPPVQPQEEPRDAFSIFVHGFVEEVKKHWWKALLIFLVPVSAIFMGAFYMCKSTGWRRWRFQRYDPENFDLKAFGLGILYLVIGFGLLLSDWDPFGLSALIMSLLSDR